MNKTHTLEELKLAQAKQPEAAPAPDYGEPWVKEMYNTELGDTGDYEGHLEILDRNNGKRIAECCNPDDENEADFDRIIACVNSMAGVPDPAAFVAQVKEMQRKINRLEWELSLQRGDIATAQKIEREGGLK